MFFKLLHYFPKDYDIDGKIDINKPLWDQSTYIGRWKHFAFITDCRTIFASERKIREAKQLCDDYRLGREPPGTTIHDIIQAKQLKDSAFNPSNDELMFFLGRMSYQLPVSVLVTTTMLTFYKNAVPVVLCQIVNQMHNAIVNYANRNAMSDDYENKNIIRNAFLYAILASSAVALGCRKILYRKGPIASRWVPLCAVVAAHFVNLPIMRQNEIISGISLLTEYAGEPIIKSRVAAVKGISECILTRIIMAVPSLMFIPILTYPIKQYCFYQQRPWILIPVESFLCALCCMFGVPSALAIFPQCNSMDSKLLKLYPPEYDEFQNKVGEYTDRLYYNKGL